MTLATFTPFIRIALRVLAGYLIGKGVSEDTASILYSDATIGAVVLLISEGWYMLARRFGWEK